MPVELVRKFQIGHMNLFISPADIKTKADQAAGTAETCNTKFGNLVNFGGFKLQGKSPFDGSPVF